MGLPISSTFYKLDRDKHVKVNKIVNIINPVLIDNTGATNYTASGTSISLSNFAIGSLGNRMLVVTVASYGAQIDPTGVTFGSQNLTQLAGHNVGGGKVWIYYLVNPLPGSSTAVTASWAGTSNYSITGCSYFNVIQSSLAFNTPSWTDASGANTTGITGSATTEAPYSRIFSSLTDNFSTSPIDLVPASPLVVRGPTAATPVTTSADEPADIVGAYTNSWTITSSTATLALLLLEVKNETRFN